VVRRVVIETLERIGKATNGRVVLHLADLSSEDLGHAQFVHERFVGAKRWVFIEGCRDPKALTLLCRGFADHPSLDRLPKLARQALKTVRAAYLLPRVVLGGGAFEAHLAHLVRERGYQLEGSEQLAALGFADALETVPFSLAENAGMDALETLLDLRARHASGEVWFGVDAASRAIVDMRTRRVYEPLSVKLRVLQSAFEISSLLTRTGAYIIQRQVAGKQARLLEERKKHLAPERVKRIHKDHFAELV
jgi:chaperonin GroEL (HSP60 family)